MKGWMVYLTLAALAGCGVETAGTAATAASIKQKELEEGKNAQARAQEKIDQASQLMQQRAQQPANDGTR